MEQEKARPSQFSESLLRLPQVEHRVGLRKSSLYRLIQESKFPAPIKAFPGARASLWLCSEIDVWVAERIRNARGAQS